MNQPFLSPMTYEQALLYGFVQGIAEYLPISSSAHLILLPRFLGTADPGLTFDVFLHLGTLFATLIYFWRDWLGIFKGMFGRGSPGDGGVQWKYIAYATIPALVAGAALHRLIETVFRGNAILMVTLVLGGLGLYLVDRLFPKHRSLETLRPRDAWLIGLAQCMALVPGMSRSGSSMIGGRLLGLDRAAAARFSFLISAPITAAAVLFELRNWKSLFAGGMDVGPLVVAGLSSFVFGMLAIGALLRLLKRFGFGTFAVYRVALAGVIYWVLGA